MRPLPRRVDDSDRQRTGAMPGAGLRTRGSALPMHGAVTDGQTAQLWDRRTIPGMSARWQGYELRDHQADKRSIAARSVFTRINGVSEESGHRRVLVWTGNSVYSIVDSSSLFSVSM